MPGGPGTAGLHFAQPLPSCSRLPDWPRPDKAGVISRLRELIFAECDFSHTGPACAGLPFGRETSHFSKRAGRDPRITKVRTIRSISKQTSFETIASRTPESAMSEAEFDLMLEAVQTAIAPAPEDDVLDSFLAETLPPYRLPRAANDNRAPWPLVPFP